MNKIIKVLHTEWSDGWGGQEIRIPSESKALIEKGYEIIIAAKVLTKIQKISYFLEIIQKISNTNTRLIIFNKSFTY